MHSSRRAPAASAALVLADGTPVVTGGQRVLDGTISVASTDFLLRSSDGYDDLGGTVTAAQHPEAGTGRITQL